MIYTRVSQIYNLVKNAVKTYFSVFIYNIYMLSETNPLVGVLGFWGFGVLGAVFIML